MAIDKRIETAKEVISKIFDGAVLMVSGFGGAGFPNFLLEILSSFLQRALNEFPCAEIKIFLLEDNSGFIFFS